MCIFFFPLLTIVKQFQSKKSNCSIYTNQDRYLPLILSTLPHSVQRNPRLTRLYCNAAQKEKGWENLSTEKQISAAAASQHCKSIQQHELVSHSHTSLSTQTTHITFEVMLNFIQPLLLTTTLSQRLKMCHEAVIRQNCHWFSQDKNNKAITVSSCLIVSCIKHRYQDCLSGNNTLRGTESIAGGKKIKINKLTRCTH